MDTATERTADTAAPTATAVAVVGAGTMGRGIAQVAAQQGHPVTLIDPVPEALERARDALRGVFEMLQRKNRLHETPDALLARISFAGELDAAAGAAWVLEAAPELLDLKQRIFRELVRVAPGAALATNTSTLSVTRIAAGCDEPERVVGLHFFNPVPLMALVEVIPGMATPAALVEAATGFARGLGKRPVVAADRPGFIVNRVARPFYGEALRLVGEGVDTADVDRVARGLGFRMGPLELLDLIGLDVNLAATESVYRAFFEEPRYRPHPLQQRMVDAGRLGRKSGRGFYRYDDDAPADERPPAPAAPPEAPGRSPVGPLPRALVLGDGALAEALRRRLGTDTAEHAALLLDCRPPTEATAPRGDAQRLPLAALQWSRSAALAQAAYGREAIGFSLLPPLGEAPVAELYPPADTATEGAALTAARRLFQAHGFATLTLPDRAGGVGFRLLAMLANEAASALAEGLASAEDIDAAMELGTNYPRGPLAWGEAIGLPALLRGLEGVFAEEGDPRYRPHPLLRRRVASGARSWT